MALKNNCKGDKEGGGGRWEKATKEKKEKDDTKERKTKRRCEDVGNDVL
jgi:hypothetical protein